MLGSASSAVGLGLLALFAIATLSRLLPPRLLVSAWQLQAANILIETGPYALLGLVLLQLGAFLDPDNESLQRRWHRLGRLGVVAVLGFLLLLPLQLLAASLSLQVASNVQRSQEQRLERNFSQLRQQVQSASSFPDLQRRLRDIQAPDLVVPAEALQLPLPRLKSRLLASVDQAEQRVRRSLGQSRAPERTFNVVRNIARGVVSTLVLALCFAAATPLWRTPQVSLLQQWHSSLGNLLHRRRGPLRLDRRADADEFLKRCGFEEESPSTNNSVLQDE